MFEKLIETIKAKNEAEAQKLIAAMNITELSKVDGVGWTALTLAALNGLEKICEALIPKMSNEAINQVTRDGNTALILAAWKGLEKVCETLIPKMSQQAINHITNDGYTALTEAVANGLEKVCETLIPKMSNEAINHVANDGYTALTEAVANGLEKVCETLIPKMSNEAINHVANDGYTALTLATQTKLEKIYEMLILRMKLVIFQNLVAEITEKLKTNTAINEKDKNTIQNSINEIIRRVETFTNKDDIDTMTKSMQELVKNKITKARIAVVEEDLNEIIEQQINLNEQIRTEKLTIFGNVIAEMTTKIKNSTTINEKDKDIIQDSIKEIVSKVQMLNNKTDIETITENVKDFISGKITKARIAVIDEDVDQLIEQQSKLSQNVIVNKLTEVIYDKPLLNYPKLLETALSKFSLQKIGELSNELSPHLVQQAIYNNDEELVLAGLTSLANDQTPTAD